MKMINWNPSRADATFEQIGVDKLVKAANIIRASVKRKLSAQIGRGATTGINRPVYRSGDNAGANWTARDFGNMLKSVRTVQKKTRSGKALSKKRNVRVYVGHYTAFYAQVFEFYRPFMRPAVEESLPMIETMIRAD